MAYTPAFRLVNSQVYSFQTKNRNMPMAYFLFFKKIQLTLSKYVTHTCLHETRWGNYCIHKFNDIFNMCEKCDIFFFFYLTHLSYWSYWFKTNLLYLISSWSQNATSSASLESWFSVKQHTHILILSYVFPLVRNFMSLAPSHAGLKRGLWSGI